MSTRRASDAQDPLTLTVNGRTITARAEPRTNLADFLRDGLDLTGTHLGCEHGVCGACTVLLDGEPARSCLTFAVACDGSDVETIEGLDLKNDIDGAAALSAALDLVLSAPTAAAATAASVGTEVWFLTAGRTWPQLGTDEYPWYRKTKVFSPEKFGAWEDLIPRAGEALAAFAKTAD